MLISFLNTRPFPTMNTINVYAHKSGPLSKAFLQVVGLTDNKLVEVADQKAADMILITNNPEDLRSLYNPTQLFCVLRTELREIAKNQPENVLVLDSLHLLDNSRPDSAFTLPGAVKRWQAAKSIAPKGQQTRSAVTNVAQLSKSYSVLIIDDSQENLQLAIEVLPGQKMVLATGPEEAMKYLNLPGQTFDAVLTDMHMRPDKLYRSLSLDTYGVTETIPYGFAMILEATKKGIPVAVVTDANHHQDWVSAMFDHIKGATVNGQKVLFFNHIGKRWDKALKALLEE